MRRASYELFADELRKQGYSNKKIREILDKMIEDGLAEGNDLDGYVLTERGVEAVEHKIFDSMGVR